MTKEKKATTTKPKKEKVETAAKEPQPQKLPAYLVPLEKVVVDKNWNPRTDYGDMELLMNQIIQNGVIQPLIVQEDKDKYVIVQGHRRRLAVEMAKEKGHDIKLPIVLEEKGSNDEIRLLKTLIGNEGKPLDLLEEAEVYRRLSAYGKQNIEIAQRVGKSAAHVGNLLVLSSASPEFKNKIRSGKISPSLAIEMIKEAREKLQMEGEEKTEDELLNESLAGDKPVKRKEVIKKARKVSISKLDELEQVLETEHKTEEFLFLQKVRQFLLGNLKLEDFFNSEEDEDVEEIEEDSTNDSGVNLADNSEIETEEANAEDDPSVPAYKKSLLDELDESTEDKTTIEYDDSVEYNQDNE